MGGNCVLVERAGGIAVLRLNEPETRNALSPAMRARLEFEVPALLARGDVRCIVLTGAGSAFCAGGDIRSLAEPLAPAAARARMARSYNWIGALLEAEIPVVTAVGGAAIGAGFGLAMLGDIVLAGDDAWFMGGFGLIGLVADFGLARALARAVGAPRAKDILLSGRRVEAEEACRIGMVSRIVPAARLEEEAMALAADLVAGPTVALGLTKSLVNAAFAGSAADYLRQEGFAQATAFGTADHREGVGAFLEKRNPRFEGR